jgi:hypothetical protein
MPRTGIRTLPSTTKLPVAKPAVFPKVKVPAVTPPAILTPQQSLKQFVTKPVVKPPRVSNKSLTKPLKSYLP